MRIGINTLILGPGQYSGVQTAVGELTRAVVASAPTEMEFRLYAHHRPPAELPAANGRVAWSQPLTPRLGRAGRIIWEQFRFPGRAMADGLDLLHCPAYVMPVMCLKPVVVNIHDLFALRQPQVCTRANRAHFWRALPRTLARAQRVIVPTAWVRDEILAYAAEKRDPEISSGLAAKIRIIPWGVGERFAPVTDPDRRSAVAARYGLPPRFVLFVGRLEPKKNIRRLIEAYFAATAEHGLPHRLVLAGPPGWVEPKATLRLIRELGLEEKVIRPGFIAPEDLPAVYSLAEAFFFPSRWEGFGLPVLEAMACGTPVVAGDIPALREVAGEAAQFAAPDDLRALRETLGAVLTNRELAADLAARGRRRAAEFSWSRTARQTLDLYAEVIACDRRRLEV